MCSFTGPNDYEFIMYLKMQLSMTSSEEADCLTF